MDFICLNCGKEQTRRKNTLGKYCDNICQGRHKNKQKIESWLSGQEEGWTGKGVQLKDFIRRWLFETRGARCEDCGWDRLHPVDGAILLEIDHVDGVATNCRPENLKILCPNCHSMTPTHRTRNKNSSRKR